MILVNDSRGDAGVLTVPWQQVSLGTLWQNTMHNGGDLQFPDHRSPVGGGGGMTNQHRATPAQWAETEKWAQGDELDSSCILELRSRIESLEAAQQDKLDRLIALDAADPTPDPAMPELRARTEALEAAQRYQFRSATEKVPTTPLYSYSVGPAKPLDELGQGHTLVSPEPASAEARPTVKESLTDGESLLEMVAKAIYNVPHDSAAEANAAIREVATWLDRFALHGSGEYAQAAKVLRQEVGQ
jgi:hypothetical protein